MNSLAELLHDPPACSPARGSTPGGQQSSQGFCQGADATTCRYFLRIEDMSEWYPCWVDGLRLQSFTDSGWQSSSGHVLRGPEHEGCWWKPVGQTCDEYYKQTRYDDGSAEPGAPVEALPGNQQRDTHDTGAAGQWQRFYTQEIADLVYDIYKEDFVAFGYKRYIVPSSDAV